MPVIAAEFSFKFHYFNQFFSNFLIYLFFKINILLCLIFFQLFLSQFVHFVGSMPTFMTDNVLFSYISMFSFFSSTIRRVFVTFPAYVWI